MKRDLRLLLPAVGIWSGAFGQSLLFGASNNRKIAFSALLLLVLLPSFSLFQSKFSSLTRSTALRVFFSSCLVGALLLAMHQSGLQRGFFLEHIGEVVHVRATLTSDVREVIGEIRGDRRQGDRFIVEVKSKSIDGVTIKVPLLLFGETDLAAHIPGEEIEFLGRVQLLPGYATVAASLTQVGSVKQATNAAWIWRWTSGIRREIKGSLVTLPEDARALIPGLVIGDRSEQNPELISVMRRSGLTHLTAVSGANFAIVAALLLLIGRGLRIRGRALWLGIALLLMLFIFLVRPSSSVLRAAVMTGVLLFARSRGVRSSPIPALAAAISLLLIINPFYVRDAGFALSVFATAGLLFLAPVVEHWLTARRIHTLIAEALAIPISATFFCLPIVVLLSGELSLISIIANLLVAPVIAIITACGVLLMIIAPMSNAAGALVGWVIAPFALWIAFVARTLAALPFAALKWPQSWIGSLAALALTLGLIMAVMFLAQTKRARKRRLIAVVAISLIVLQLLFSMRPLSNSWIPDDWRIFQCDVGQGDGLVIKSGAHRAVVIDVGPDERAIDRCLRALEITTIDLLILTHFHADHVAGLTGVIQGREITTTWLSPTREPAAEADLVSELLKKIPIVTPRVGTNFDEADVQIRVVAVAAHTEPNDSSISILANIGGISLFAAGDLELEGQARVLTALAVLAPSPLWDRSPIDLMKGIHHGSALQDPELIALLRPRVSIFSVGADNPYGHPSQSALDLYGRYGAIYRTDRNRSIALAKRAGNLIVIAAPPSPWAL